MTTTELMAVHAGEVALAGNKRGIRILLLPLCLALEDIGGDTEADKAKVNEMFIAWTPTRAVRGGVWMVEAFTPGPAKQITFGKFLGLWPNDTERAAWQATSLGVAAELRRARAEKQAKADDPIRDAAEPLRQLYHRTPYSHRQAVLAKILYEVTR